MVDLLVKYENPEVRQRASLRTSKKGDCGFDLYNASNTNITILPHQSCDIHSGISVKIPDDHFGIIRSRSSTFSRRGLFVITGVIDSGYTGPLFTFVWNPALNGGHRPIIIAPWERLSQLVVVPQPQIEVLPVDVLPITDRGDKGFGSTGL